MLHEPAHGPFRLNSSIIRDLTNDEFRHEYMMDQVRSYIAFQIRALREQPGRKWSQVDLADRCGKKQSVISRLEDPDYGKLSLQSLLEIAIAFDLPLLVQFVEWEDWLPRMNNQSPSGMRKMSFNADRLLRLSQSEESSDASSGLRQEPRSSDASRVGNPGLKNEGKGFGWNDAANSNNQFKMAMT